jgi:alpha-L-fucosidase
MTMNDSWGFKRADENWKSQQTLIRTLCDIASKGGNFLLNVGPTAEGLIPEPSVERLRAMGAWLKVNGEAIYGTHAGPFERLKWGRATAKPERLFLHVFDWPTDGTLRLPGMLNEVRGAHLLGAPDASLSASTDDGGVTIVGLPASALDPDATVIALDIVGEPAVVPSLLAQAADGSITLDAIDAIVKGSARYESREDRRCIGYWTNPSDIVHWDVLIRSPGRFRVVVELACEPGQEGSRYRVSAGDAIVEDTVPATKEWADFVTRDLGEIEMTRPGRTRLTVAAQDMPHGAVMNLRSVRLVPVPARWSPLEFGPPR